MMVQLINIGNEGTYENELNRLAERPALKRRLIEIDKIRAFRRIYVVGCGRSGTWLLTSVMTTFKNIEVVMKELPVAYFGLFKTDRSILVLKRNNVAYQKFKDIPRQIEMVYIIRHPFDVLTSHLPISQRPYHILPDRWLGEMAALRYLIDSGRKKTMVLRYEDLVSKPVETQVALADFFNLEIGVPIDQVVTGTKDASGKTIFQKNRPEHNWQIQVGREQNSLSAKHNA
jgi:hypothetical protein